MTAGLFSEPWVTQYGGLRRLMVRLLGTRVDIHIGGVVYVTYRHRGRVYLDRIESAWRV
jgi:hypothetical protein